MRLDGAQCIVDLVVYMYVVPGGGVAPLLRWGRHNAGALGFLLRVVTSNQRLIITLWRHKSLKLVYAKNTRCKNAKISARN